MASLSAWLSTKNVKHNMLSMSYNMLNDMLSMLYNMLKHVMFKACHEACHITCYMTKNPSNIITVEAKRAGGGCYKKIFWEGLKGRRGGARYAHYRLRCHFHWAVFGRGGSFGGRGWKLNKVRCLVRG